MKSIFNTSDNQEFIQRIHKLTPETQALWGKMNVSQMLYHCARPLQAATGELKVKRGLVSFIFGKMAKKKFTGEAMFTKNLPTDKRFIPTNTPDFNEEKKRLTDMLNKFLQTGKGIISDEPHPFFGRLTADEWDIIQAKHLDHHLSQFGV
jgi:hypothetical protein